MAHRKWQRRGQLSASMLCHGRCPELLAPASFFTVWILLCAGGKVGTTGHKYQLHGLHWRRHARQLSLTPRLITFNTSPWLDLPLFLTFWDNHTQDCWGSGTHTQALGSQELSSEPCTVWSLAVASPLPASVSSSAKWGSCEHRLHRTTVRIQSDDVRKGFGPPAWHLGSSQLTVPALPV